MISKSEARDGDFSPVTHSGMFPGQQTSFETKDSGARAQFASGMQRDTSEGKVRWDLALDGPIFKRYAELMTRGAVKYEARNWMKAQGEEEAERYRESACRHFFQWLNGETDEDHAAAVVFNLNGYEYVLQRLKDRAADALHRRTSQV